MMNWYHHSIILCKFCWETDRFYSRTASRHNDALWFRDASGTDYSSVSYWTTPLVVSYFYTASAILMIWLSAKPFVSLRRKTFGIMCKFDVAISFVRNYHPSLKRIRDVMFNAWLSEKTG